MPVLLPYKLQIFFPEEMRVALKKVAHRHETSVQKLVVSWLREKLSQEPEGRNLPAEDANA